MSAVTAFVLVHPDRPPPVTNGGRYASPAASAAAPVALFHGSPIALQDGTLDRAYFLSVEGDQSITCKRETVDFFSRWTIRVEGASADDARRPVCWNDRVTLVSALFSVLSVNSHGRLAGVERSPTIWSLLRAPASSFTSASASSPLSTSSSAASSPVLGPMVVRYTPLGRSPAASPPASVSSSPVADASPQRSGAEWWGILHAQYRLAALRMFQQAKRQVREKLAHDQRIMLKTRADNADKATCVACWDCPPDTVVCGTREFGVGRICCIIMCVGVCHRAGFL